jgi:hypothetical protein
MVPRVYLTNLTAVLLSKRGLQMGYQWILARGRECYHCRECERKVSFFESICPNCGVANPIKIAISPTSLICVLSLLAMVSWYSFV